MALPEPEALLLRVVAGPVPTGFALVRPGAKLLIGRERSADLWVDDPEVSRSHAEVSFEEGEWVLCDVGSQNGTWVNGEAVRRAVLRVGDEISVGSSKLRLEPLGGAKPVEPAPPVGTQTEPAAPAPDLEAPAERGPQPTAESEDAVAAEEPARRRPLQVWTWIEPGPSPKLAPAAAGSLLRRLTDAVAPENGGRLYALVDSAQDEQYPPSLARLGYKLYTLFEGEWAEALAHVGPCLVPVEPLPEPLLASWVEARGRLLGILIESDAELADLLAHLRSIFVVTDEDDQEFFFRYYDPRVLETFLPTCTEEQLEEFFGPISRIVTETEEVDGYRLLTPRAGAIEAEDVVEAP